MFCVNLEEHEEHEIKLIRGNISHFTLAFPPLLRPRRVVVQTRQS